jgi:hypothetical protein
VLSVLQYTDFDCPFGIFKLFSHVTKDKVRPHCRVYLVTNPVISREWGKENHNPEMFRIHTEYDFHHLILMESSVRIETGTAREVDPGYVFDPTNVVVIDTDCIGRCKSNYYTIMNTTAPILMY